MSDTGKSINDLIRELRDQINASVALRNNIYQKKDGSWDRLWAAMDALEDAQQAIESFQTTPGVGYLELYGLLQAFVVQQDSIDHIRQTVLEIPNINWSKDEPRLNEVRRLRNETIGHPAYITAKEGVLYSNINRSSIMRKSFEYILWSTTGPRKVEVDIPGSTATQKNEVRRLISSTMAEIRAKEKEFIESFSGKKVKDVYSSVSYYYFEKLYDHKNNPELAKSMLTSFKETYVKVRDMLEERYGDFGSTTNVPGLKDAIEELDQLLKRVEEKIPTAAQDEFDYSVYIEILEKKWEELGGMIDETDKRFSTDDGNTT